MNKVYDFNVYCDGKEVSLTAYELMLQDGSVCMNTDRYRTLKWRMTPQNDAVISFLFDDPFWDEKEWEDHDQWLGFDELIRSNTPKEVLYWLDMLPEYEMEIRDYGRNN